MYTEAHCGSSDCRCTHQEPCYKGWIDDVEFIVVKPNRNPNENGTVVRHTGAAFCPTCRPEQAYIMKSFPREIALKKLQERGGLGRFTGKTEVL